jgi:inner membrane protein
MLRRTHLAIGLASAFYFLPRVNSKLIFLAVVIISTLLPDLDRGMNFFKFDYWRGKPPTPGHRSFLHSYTICILVAILLAFIYPLLALPFFLGYSLHLFADSFTMRGIKPFWPLKFTSSGKISTGGKMESVIFFVFVLIDVFLVVFWFV